MGVALPRSVRVTLESAPFRDVVVPYLAQRSLLLLAVCFAAQLLQLSPESVGRLASGAWTTLPHAALLDPWLRWDSEFYLMIASVGYGRSAWGTPNAFFPLYPWLVRGLGVVLPLPIAALVVAHAAGLAAFILLHRLVSEIDGRERARRAVWLGLLFPTSFFLSAAYAESVYLALTLGAVVGWHRKRPWLAAACVVGACLARPPGVFTMSLPFVIDWALRRQKVRDAPWFALAAGVGAGLVFLTYKVSVGDPLAFVRSPTVQALQGLGGDHQRSPAPFWAVLLDEGMGQNLMRRLVNFSALLLGAGVTVHFARRREFAFAGITALSVLVPLAAHGTVLDAASMGRYLMVAFPLYLALARWVPEGPASRVVEYGFALLQCVLAVLFGVGVWAE